MSQVTITLSATDLYLLKSAVIDKIERLQDEQREFAQSIPLLAETAAEREAELQALNAILQRAGMSRLLVECGEALYGPRWQSDLARDLGVSDRTMRRWAAGTTDVPPGLWVDLLRLTQERAAVLDALAPRLRRAA